MNSTPASREDAPGQAPADSIHASTEQTSTPAPLSNPSIITPTPISAVPTVPSSVPSATSASSASSSAKVIPLTVQPPSQSLSATASSAVPAPQPQQQQQQQQLQQPSIQQPSQPPQQPPQPQQQSSPAVISTAMPGLSSNAATNPVPSAPSQTIGISVTGQNQQKDYTVPIMTPSERLLREQLAAQAQLQQQSLAAQQAAAAEKLAAAQRAAAAHAAQGAARMAATLAATRGTTVPVETPAPQGPSLSAQVLQQQAAVAAAAATQQQQATYGGRLPPMVGTSTVIIPNLKLKDIGSPQIFKATYSGVPVFEMICRGVAVMRRRSDSYLNATQILKVAEFDKAQRTRILEREVQRGEHEKVQGGYGKYQGTWVPYARGVQLCQEYHVLDLLQPLLDYETSKTSSPPLAPKHITAATGKPRKLKEPREPRAPRPKKRKPKEGLPGPAMGAVDGNGQSTARDGEDDDELSNSEVERDYRDEEMPSRAGSEASMDETMSVVTGPSRTPSPLESRLDSSDVSDNDAHTSGHRRPRSSDQSPRNRKKQRSRPGDELFVGYHGAPSGYESPGGTRSRREHSSNNHPRRRHGDAGEDEKPWQAAINAGSAQGHYAEALLTYFVSDSTVLPPILTNPPADLDFDLIIDEEGHTPLHWAVAMARTKIVRLLVQHGADVYRVNNQGQTALMRSVLFTNNFDLKTFPSLLEILQKTIFTIDKNDQTVFHHVAVTAGMRGKVHASRYYMECLLDKLALHPSELESIINVQDIAGDTALTIAARIGNKKVLRLLMDAGADSKIRNKSGRNADDYMQEADIQILGASTSSIPALNLSQQSSSHSHSSSHPSQYPSTPPQLNPHQPNQPHPSSPHSGSNGNISNANSNTQRSGPTMAHHHHHSSSTSSRQHQGHDSPSPYGHPSSSLRSVTPPPSRHHGYSSSNAPMDRTPHSGYQEYSHSGSPRNPFQAQSASSPSHHPRVSSARGSPMHESHRGYNEGNGHGPSSSSSTFHQPPPSSHSHQQVPSPHHLQPQAPSSFSSAAANLSPGGGAAGNGTRASQRMIPAVTDLFEQLTQSYESDLYEKEQDLISARNLLHGIQSEIQEGHKSIEELRAKTVYLSQAEEQIRTLEGMIRQEMNLRQRLRLEDLVVNEEAKLKRDVEFENTQQAPSMDMGRTLALEKEAAELRTSLAQLQEGRKEQVEQIVQLKSQQGKRRHEYKRLIALCCNVSIEEVDGLLGPLLNTLGNEDTVA
ncbi:transcription factor MBP1 [Entomortierella parvispora]|uniref:Transcription factor MBP1 n=1 Tax=Entomortierella parvispora TaxID=205924 RepID=A0A9P3LS94_9FUNG|nr:transcription factor MBP1 [Entomortierella parvispora]